MKMDIPLVLLCLLGEPLLDLLAGLRLELVLTDLEGLLALRLVSLELHCPPDRDRAATPDPAPPAPLPTPNTPANPTEPVWDV